MDRKRRSVSRELLPYKSLVRGINEPKYDFRALIPRKRRYSRRKRVVAQLQECSVTATVDDLQTNSSKDSSATCAMLLQADSTVEHLITLPEEDTVTTYVMPMSEDPSTETHVYLESSTSDSPPFSGDVLTEGDTTEKPQAVTLKLDISAVEAYTLLLKQDKVGVFCNYSLTAVMVQDFECGDECSIKLKRNKFVVVQRRGIIFRDMRCEWGYWCYCNPSNCIKSMYSQVEITYYDELELLAPQCMHIKAVKALFEAFDTEHELTPNDFVNDPNMQTVTHVVDEIGFEGIFPIGQDGSMVCVCTPIEDNEYGVVSVVNRKLYCMLCHRACKHVLHVEQLMESENCPESLEILSMSLRSSSQKSYKAISPVGISWKKTPSILLPSTQQRILCKGAHYFVSNASRDEELIIPSPILPQQCPTCRSVLQKSQVALPLIFERSIHKGLVYRLSCSNDSCGLVVHFDGSDVAILNMGIFLISYGVLRSYMHNFLQNGCPLYTFHNIMSATHADSGQRNFKTSFPYHWLRAAWYHYLNILDVDYRSGFMCPKCGEQPTSVVCDATSLAFRRQLLPSEEEVSPYTDELPLLQGSSIHERVFIDDSKCRQFLKTYAATATNNDVLTQYVTSDVDDLVTCLTEHCPVLVDLIVHMEKPVPCPCVCSSLFSDLSTMSPVCALLTPIPQVINLMNDLCNGLEVRKFPERWQLLQDNVPILHDLLCKLGPEKASLPFEYRPLVMYMVHKAQLPFAACPLHPCVPVSAQAKDNHSYFPHLPVLWERRRYKSDKQRDASCCTKLYRGHPSLLPGIFTLFCPHGVCYGFQLMFSCESPNMPFTIFRTRFATAPKYIVYDNACGLHTYCLNRDPNFFKTTKFLVDRFHWSNHKGCSRAYNIDYYPSLSHLNTEVNEQANSSISMLKSQLSYMNERNFFNHLKLFLWYRNQAKLNNTHTSM